MFARRYSVVMDKEFLQHNWALLAACVLLAIVGIIVARAAWAQSLPGRLRQRAADYRAAERDCSRAEAAVRALEERLARTRAKADTVAPKALTQLEGQVADAQALAKIARDKVLVAANLLRQVIVEEYPLVEQARLRERYFPAEAERAPTPT